MCKQTIYLLYAISYFTVFRRQQDSYRWTDWFRAGRSCEDHVSLGFFSARHLELVYSYHWPSTLKIVFSMSPFEDSCDIMLWHVGPSVRRSNACPIDHRIKLQLITYLNLGKLVVMLIRRSLVSIGIQVKVTVTVNPTRLSGPVSRSASS